MEEYEELWKQNMKSHRLQKNIWKSYCAKVHTKMPAYLSSSNFLLEMKGLCVPLLKANGLWIYTPFQLFHLSFKFLTQKVQ